MVKRMREGTCKLTLRQGRFVDSHLIPKALTRADGLGPGLVQHGHGRTERRRSSWYDNALVTVEGEAILARYDDLAIRTMRRHLLVWSGWGPARALSDVRAMPGSPLGTRRIQFADRQSAVSLRLFLLSILWRAAASERPEFEEVTLASDDLEALRLMVLEGNPEPFEFYPASLVQLSTLGERHNHTPLAMRKPVPGAGKAEAYIEDIYRFYFDGLIVHFSRSSIEENIKRGLAGMRVGEQDTLLVTTTTYEASAQAANLAVIKAEAMLGRPLLEAEMPGNRGWFGSKI